MNIKKINSISLNPADANRTYSAYDTIYVKDNQWFINDEPTGKTTTDIKPRKQFQFYTDCQNIEQVNTQMAIFDQQLNTLQKEINYWDIYRIKAQVTNTDSVEAVYALLRPGESLVINTDAEIQYYDSNKTAWTLKRGDVIIKTLDSTAIVVKALAQGIYYPAKVAKANGSYSILYQFSTVIPDKTATVERAINADPILPADLTQNLLFKSLSDDVKTQPYNLKLSSDNLVFPVITVVDNGNNVVISPCIKFYTTSSNEEIYLDFTLTTRNNGANWVITPSVNFPANFFYVLVK